MLRDLACVYLGKRRGGSACVYVRGGGGGREYFRLMYGVIKYISVQLLQRKTKKKGWVGGWWWVGWGVGG